MGVSRGGAEDAEGMGCCGGIEGARGLRESTPGVSQDAECAERKRKPENSAFSAAPREMKDSESMSILCPSNQPTGAGPII